MVAIALAFVLCLVPSLSLYFWVRSLQKEKPGYTDGCRKALINGFICTVPVVLVALALNIIVAVNLALISLITAIVMIVFFARRKRNPEYTTPLGLS